MNNRITRREITKRFILAIELLLEWIEQRESSNQNTRKNIIEEPFHTSHLLKAPDVAKILNISERAEYQLIQQREIRSVHINSNVRVRQEDLENFINHNLS